MQDAVSEIESKLSEKDWRDLAVAATTETDPEKLGRIIEKLCDALDKRRAQKQSQATPSAKKPA